MTATPESTPPFVFPSTWKGSWATWWRGHAATAHQTEEALLKRGLGDIELTRDVDAVRPSDRRSAVLRQTQLEGRKDRYINYLEIGTGERKPNEHNLVLLHGYGGGLAYYMQQLRAMSSIPNTRLYVLDMMGMGRSGRPPFPKPKITAAKGSGEAVRQRVTQAENVFIDSLEEWRHKEGIPKMTLMGHSLGGYFSAGYTLKHPDRINKLVLISPVGVPQAPYDLPDTNDEQVEAIAEAEFRDSAKAASGNGRAQAPNGWWTKLWEANVSPFAILRLSSFAGPKVLSTYAARRYAAFPSEVQKELFDYLYLICSQKGSGEYALAHILAPGAFARWPLIHRLKPLSHPITFIYGDHDWMDSNGGKEALKMLQAKAKTTETELQQKRSKVVVNPHSGHWVFLENPEGFNDIIVKEIEEVVKDHAPA